MNRRDALVGVFALGAAGVTPVCAQPRSKVWRIGFISGDTRQSIMEPGGRYEAFSARLRELGYVEGKNLQVEKRFADFKLELLPALAEELVAMKPDAIMAQGTPSARAMMRVTRNLPVVFHVADALASGLITSLARPGGNLTGITSATLDVSEKYLEFLKLAVPDLKRVGVLTNSSNPQSVLVPNSIGKAAMRAGVTIHAFGADTPESIDAGLAAIARERLGAVIVPSDSLYFRERRRIAELALKYRLPTIFAYDPPVKAGGLMSYGNDILGEYRRTGDYIDKILKGAKPSELPVEQPMRLELVVNAKTAKALGIAMSQELLLRASRVIE